MTAFGDDGSLTVGSKDRGNVVLALMAEGRTNAYIARTLCVSERAVVQHTSHIYDELDLPATDEDHRRVLAVLRYLADEG